KLDCEGKITVNRASVEERLGRPWNLQELHLVLISMAGNLDEDDDYFTLSWRH
ncbi:MmoB/DmpM family protein, partial [Acidocella sp.]